MSSGELWFVKLPNGAVHHVTLDQLDAAFEAGHIDARTPVLSDGATQWTTLGEAAGLEDAPVAPAPVAAPSPTPAPVVMSVAAPTYAAQPAPVSYAPRQAPVSYAPRSAPVSYAPRSAPVSYVPPAANSLRPVAMDLGSDPYLGDVPFKKRSGKGWVVAVLTLAVVGGGVGFAAANGHLAIGDSPLVAAAAAPPATPPAPPPRVDPMPAAAPTPPQAPLAGTLPAMDSPLNPRFNDAQKDKLLQADKVREDRSKARQSSHGYSASTSTKYKSSSTFSKGGNKYDPLNSDL
jgi:hypothetical protein